MLNVSKPLPDREFIRRLRAIMPTDGPRLPIVAGGGNWGPGWEISNQAHWTYARRVFGLVIDQLDVSSTTHAAFKLAIEAGAKPFVRLTFGGMDRVLSISDLTGGPIFARELAGDAAFLADCATVAECCGGSIYAVILDGTRISRRVNTKDNEVLWLAGRRLQMMIRAVLGDDVLIIGYPHHPHRAHWAFSDRPGARGALFGYATDSYYPSVPADDAEPHRTLRNLLWFCRGRGLSGSLLFTRFGQGWGNGPGGWSADLRYPLHETRDFAKLLLCDDEFRDVELLVDQSAFSPAAMTWSRHFLAYAAEWARIHGVSDAGL